MTRACMGGWCPHRLACPNYDQADRREPSENLCNEIDRMNETNEALNELQTHETNEVQA